MPNTPNKSEPTDKLKAIKITSSLWVGRIGDHIKKYHKRIKPVGMTYETLFTYFGCVAQLGGDDSEFWIVYNPHDSEKPEEWEPLGFGVWYKMPNPPHLSKVHCDHLCSWGKASNVARALITEFIEFGKKHRSVLYDATVPNKATYELFERIAKKMGYEVIENERINFCVRMK